MPQALCEDFAPCIWGYFFNCLIMATVNLAACKIAAILFGLERWQTPRFCRLA